MIAPAVSVIVEEASGDRSIASIALLHLAEERLAGIHGSAKFYASSRRRKSLTPGRRRVGPSRRRDRSGRHRECVVEQSHDPTGMRGDVLFVRDEDDRVASQFSSSKSAMISAPVAESRFPVGSSARRMLGSLISARATATRCALPARELVRRWCVIRSREADRLERLRPRARAGSFRARSGVDQRELDLLQGVVRGSRLNVWNTKPISWLRIAASSSSVMRATSRAVQDVGARGRRVQASDQVHERRLAGPGRAHDRRRTRPRSTPRDTPSKAFTFSGAHLVDLRDVANVDQHEKSRHGEFIRFSPLPGFGPKGGQWKTAARPPCQRTRTSHRLPIRMATFRRLTFGRREPDHQEAEHPDRDEVDRPRERVKHRVLGRSTRKPALACVRSPGCRRG